MKRVAWMLLLIVLGASLVAAISKENLYLYDSLQVQLHIKGQIDLVPTAKTTNIQEASAELLLYPRQDFRQEVIRMDNTGEVKAASTLYHWDKPTLGAQAFGYTATITTNNHRLKVSTKIPYPLKDIKGYEQYTLPSEKIDSNNPTVVAKASELAAGEDDLFKLSFKLASWVEENVVYDLNTLTATASQKASWVLENKQGVCDEMTSLFVAMMRSLGVPARFVSGVSYTTSDLFDENWQPHGWAEVYFPDIGWVSFDITFGQYGYVDVTHIKLRDGLDPSEPATKYQWLAENVDLKAKPLEHIVNVEKKGRREPDELVLEAEPLAKEAGFESYNLIKGIVKNTADYYTATALQLAVPEEVKVIGRNRRNLLLGPKEVKETFWIVKVDDTLDTNFIYQFPTMIYSEKNVSVVDSFSIQKNQKVYTQQDIEKLTVTNEEKSYSRKVALNCDYPHEIMMGQEVKVTCTIHNNGDKTLSGVNWCLNQVCEIVNIPSTQQKESAISIKADTVGWANLIVSAENQEIEKKTSFSYVVLDQPKVHVKADTPKTVEYAKSFDITMHLSKASFSTPEQVKVLLEGPGFQSKWEIESLSEDQQFVVAVHNFPMSSSNQFVITTSWKDKEGKAFSDTQNIEVQAKAQGVLETIKLWLNGILKWFY